MIKSTLCLLLCLVAVALVVADVAADKKQQQHLRANQFTRQQHMQQQQQRNINDDHDAILVQLNDDENFDNPVKQKSYTPLLFWHGMGDCARCSIDGVRKALQGWFPGMPVFSVQIGSDSIADRYNSYIGNSNKQIEQVCEEIIANPIIKSRGRLNLLGFSQGCQLLRGLVQRCPLAEKGIKVKNFVSLGGQHQGVFGLPNCDIKLAYCKYISLVFFVAYEPQIQERSIQAQYWHDPMQEQLYKTRSVFLANINNEIVFNETYKRNLMKLEQLVLVEFGQDDIVVPRETSLFGYYEPGQSKRIVPLEESYLYTQDRIGIKYLDDNKRLHKLTIDGNHLQFNMTWFEHSIARVFYDN